MSSFKTILTLLGCLALMLAAPIRAEEPFVVHEWGVWVRQNPAPLPFDATVVQPNPGASTPNNTLGAPAELFGELPAFALLHDKQYQAKTEQMIRSWRKPVLHFYGPDGLQLKVTIKTPQGRPTAYWPAPSFIEETKHNQNTGVTVTDAAGMVWEGSLSAAAPKELPKAPEKHWWNNLRAVPGLYFNGAKGSERFIFYEATARQEPVLKGTLTKDALTLQNTHSEASGPVLVVVNDGQTLWWANVKDVPAGGNVELPRAELQKSAGEAEKLLEAARAQWLAFGLTKEEAAAIVETWKPDLTGHLGFMVIARLPALLYDQIFPLTIEPKPAQTVRVGLIFDTLPGEAARTAWLPALRKQLDGIAADLSSEDFSKRTAAKLKLGAFGDLIGGYLAELTKSDDVEVRNAANSLLEQLKPKAANNRRALSGGPQGGVGEEIHD